MNINSLPSQWEMDNREGVGSLHTEASESKAVRQRGKVFWNVKGEMVSCIKKIQQES